MLQQSCKRMLSTTSLKMSKFPVYFKSLIYSSHNVDECTTVLKVQDYKPPQDLQNSIVLRTLAFPTKKSSAVAHGRFFSKPTDIVFHFYRLVRSKNATEM